MTTDGKLTLTSGAYSVDIPVPEYGYKSIVSLGIDVEKLDDGTYTIYDNGTTYDKYRCECWIILTPTEMANLNTFLKTSARANTSISLAMPSGSGFFPFTPLRGDAGTFTVAVIVSDTEKIGESPYLYFRVKLIIYNQSTFPSYSIGTVDNEGAFNVTLDDTTITGRFPIGWTNPSGELGIYDAILEDNSVEYVDRGITREKWTSNLKFTWSKNNTANFLSKLISTVRGGDFTITPQENTYMYGRDLASTATYTTRIIQDTIDITHDNCNQFTFSILVNKI
jgi:hypothetical protein